MNKREEQTIENNLIKHFKSRKFENRKNKYALAFSNDDERIAFFNINAANQHIIYSKRFIKNDEYYWKSLTASFKSNTNVKFILNEFDKLKSKMTPIIESSFLG